MTGGRRRWLAPELVLLAVVASGCAARRDATLPAPPAPCPSPSITPAPALSPTPEPPRATPSPHAARRRRNVVLLGDSTTYGTPKSQQDPALRVAMQSPYQPGAALEALLALEPPRSAGGTPWRDAKVHNLAIAASTTDLWLTEPPRFCKTAYARYPLVASACRRNVAWVKGVPLALGGTRIDAVIVDLGINDLQLGQSPAETVARLKLIREALAPAPVLFFPPIAPPDGPRGAWPQEVRAEMVKQGLFDETQYPAYVPTYDGLHPTDGGYAAKAALWLDALRKLP